MRGFLTTPGAGRLFRGPHGVPVIWRLLLFVALYAVQVVLLAIAVSLALRFLLPHPPRLRLITPGAMLLNEVVLLLPALGATAVMAWLEDVRFIAYGLIDTRRRARFAAGFIAGLALIFVLVFVLAATGYGTASPGTLSALATLRYGVEWLGVCVVIGFTEEFLFRGYILVAIARRYGLLAAAVVSSLSFAGRHGSNPGETVVGLLDLLFAGAVLSLGIYWTRSLYWSIGCHAAWDFSENFLYGTHDSGTACFGTLMNFAPRGNEFLSGGPTGPEGSVFSLLVIGSGGLVLWFWFRRRGREAADSPR
jgi:membrane protease YdiL (CAAX protease family)